MSSATGISAGAERGQPAEVSGKKKREAEAPPEAKEGEENVVKRKYGLDFDPLECPICTEPFSPPVYQCQNGHTACSACCKKLPSKKCRTCSLPTGAIRCIAIEKILDSLLVSCKYAENGCKEMLKPSKIEVHERDDCEYEPFECPMQGCDYEGSAITLPKHLSEEHRVQTAALNNICGAGFIMKSSDQIVMVKSDEESNLLYLVHRELEEKLGDVFFCTSIAGSWRRFSLKAAFCSDPSICLSISGAKIFDLRGLKERCLVQTLVLPFIQPAADVERPVELHFRVAGYEDNDV